MYMHKLLMNYGFREAYFKYFESCNFSRENTNIDVSVFMVDLRIINMSSDLAREMDKTTNSQILIKMKTKTICQCR
jgi:hypothetical protein